MPVVMAYLMIGVYINHLKQLRHDYKLLQSSQGRVGISCHNYFILIRRNVTSVLMWLSLGQRGTSAVNLVFFTLF